jgi:hypothetical protein
MSYALVNLYNKLSPERDDAERGIAIGEIIAMGVNPNTLYCYWEINHLLFTDIILTIYNQTEEICWEIEVSQKIGNLYVGIGQKRGDTACEFQVAMGIKMRTDESVMPIAVSNIVSVPPIAPSNRLDQEWWGPHQMATGSYEERESLGEAISIDGISSAEGVPSTDGVPSSFCLALK